MTVWVSTKLPQELADKVQDLALSERRSYAQMVAMLCEEALAVRERPRKRQEAVFLLDAVSKVAPSRGELLQPGGEA